MWRFISLLSSFLKGGVPTLVEDTEPLPVKLPQAQIDELQQVTVGNLPGTFPDGHTQPLTAAQLTAAGLATAVKQLPNNHDVTVTNFPAPQPGLATEATLQAFKAEAKTESDETQAAITNLNTDIGQQEDAAATTDTGTFSLISLFKRLLAVVARAFVSTKDTGNSTLMTSASGLTFLGAWFDLRSSLFPLMRLFAAQECIVVPININEGANGPLTITFNFKFSDDGVTPTVNENRLIDEFGSLSNYSLKNVGSFFRGSLTLSRALVGTEQVVLATDQWYVTPPPFIRLATQSIEEQNAAMPQTFAFLQVFDTLGISRVLRGIQAAQTVTSSMYALLVKSIPVGRNPDGLFADQPVSGQVSAAASDAQLAHGAFYLSPAIDFTMFSHMLVMFVADRTLDVEYQLSMNPAASFVQHGTSIPDVYDAAAVGTLYRRLVTDQSISIRVKITNNSGVATTNFGVRVVMQTDTASSVHTRMDSLITNSSLGAMFRGVLSGKPPTGPNFENVGTDGLGRLLTNVGSDFSRLLQSSVENNQRLKADAAPTTVITGSITDGATTINLPTITSPGGLFRPWMRGATITGTGIPANTSLIEVTSATSAVMSANATLTNSGLTLSTSQKALVIAKCPLAAYDGDATHDLTLLTFDRSQKPTSFQFRTGVQFNQRFLGW